MWKCIRCEKENPDTTEKCVNCGHGKNMDYIHHRTLSKIQGNISANWKSELDSPEYFKEKAIEHLRKSAEYFQKADLYELDKAIQNILCNLDEYISFKKEPPILKNLGNSALGGGNIFCKDIYEIEFVKIQKNKIPDRAWEVPSESKEKIWAWTTTGNKEMCLYIGSEKGVCAPENCWLFFSSYINVRKIRFNGLFDTSNVKNMAQMFFNCNNLQSVDLESIDTGMVTNMRLMFGLCNSLKEADLQSFNTENVTDMFGMFFYCQNLEKLELGSFKTSKVKNMSEMFYNCENLYYLGQYRFDMEKVEDTSRMFYNCRKMNSLDILQFYEAVKDREIKKKSMFDGCNIQKK